MAVAVAGLWELGWNTPIKEADLWEFMLRDLGVSDWMMAPITGIAGLPVVEYPTMEAILAARRGELDVVFLDENAETELADFQHPASALYVCGRVASSPFKTHRQPGDLAVKVGTPTNTGTIWPHQIAAIVLYHRWTQWP